MTVDVSQFHGVFFDESFEHLANMEMALLQLDGAAADPELINVIFRGAHSIKGGSATFGFTAVADFTHLAETLLERIRAGSCAVSAASIAALLEAVDVLRALITALKDGSDADAERAAAAPTDRTSSGARLRRGLAHRVPPASPSLSHRQ